MRKSRFSEEQILKLAEAGQRVADLCRQHGISQGTFYRWRTKYGGLEVSELHRLKQLESENERLKRLVADVSLDNAMLKDAVQRK